MSLTSAARFPNPLWCWKHKYLEIQIQVPKKIEIIIFSLPTCYALRYTPSIKYSHSQITVYAQALELLQSFSLLFECVFFILYY